MPIPEDKITRAELHEEIDSLGRIKDVGSRARRRHRWSRVWEAFLVGMLALLFYFGATGDLQHVAMELLRAWAE